jgi:hypothetical protein
MVRVSFSSNVGCIIVKCERTQREFVKRRTPPFDSVQTGRSHTVGDTQAQYQYLSATPPLACE